MLQTHTTADSDDSLCKKFTIFTIVHKSTPLSGGYSFQLRSHSVLEVWNYHRYLIAHTQFECVQFSTNRSKKAFSFWPVFWSVKNTLFWVGVNNTDYQTCRCCSDYFFILDLTHGVNGLSKDERHSIFGIRCALIRYFMVHLILFAFCTSSHIHFRLYRHTINMRRTKSPNLKFFSSPVMLNLLNNQQRLPITSINHQ